MTRRGEGWEKAPAILERDGYGLHHSPTRKRADCPAVWKNERPGRTDAGGGQRTAETAAGAVSPLSTAWHSIPWQTGPEQVRRRQARIVPATQAGQWHTGHAVQHGLTHSCRGKALAVRRVTAHQGKHTPGVDQVTWKDPESTGMAIHRMPQRGDRTRPLRRGSLPPSNGTNRPLGIPPMQDRARPALPLHARDPSAATQADPHADGLRKARSGADAMEQWATRRSRSDRPPWILAGDLQAGGDTISHQWWLNHIPMDKAILSQGLQAGYRAPAVLDPTEDGTPQGGISSPVLAKMALDGLERRLHQQYPQTGQRALKGKHTHVHLVRYAADCMMTGISQEGLAWAVKPLVRALLRQRGLERSAEQTRRTHREEGGALLGQHVRP